jgi:hypothetical protein
MEEEIDSRVKRLRHGIWTALRTYSDSRISRQEKKHAKELLGDLIRRAIYLDLDMKKHTADLSLSFERSMAGREFDPRRMEEVVYEDGEGSVGLIASPPLFKEEDPIEGVSQRRLLEKAQVCSGTIERLPQSSTQRALVPIYTINTQHPSQSSNRDHSNRPPTRARTDGRSSRSSHGLAPKR